MRTTSRRMGGPALSRALAVLIAAPTAGACHRKPTPSPTAAPASASATPAASIEDVPPTGSPPPAGKRCVVHLHGKGQHGAAPEVAGDVTHLRPDGNADGWSGKQWLYFPDARYDEIRAIVTKAVTDAACDRVVVHGFSNGAAAAGKLYCRGETFGGKAIGYIVDDPVPDHGADGCKPPRGVRVKLYWTTGLANAVDGWRCSSADWTCEGGKTIGIDRYARLVGAVVTPSIKTTHEAYEHAPQETSWR